MKTLSINYCLCSSARLERFTRNENVPGSKPTDVGEYPGRGSFYILKIISRKSLIISWTGSLILDLSFALLALSWVNCAKLNT